mgnify:CR=1 FL=1
MCDKSKNDWQIVAKGQENTDKVAQKPAPDTPARAIGKDGACKPQCQVFEEKWKKLKKVVDMTIWMWYIFIALDKKKSKKSVKSLCKTRVEMIFENWAKRQDYLSS